MTEKNSKHKNNKENNKNISREKYLKKLKSMLKDIPEDGLVFLIKQAGILIHNAEVENSNQMQSEAAAIKEAAEKSSDKTAEKKVKTVETLSIDEKVNVSLERGAFGKSFIIRFGDTGKTFGEMEIAELLRLTDNSESEEDGCRRIFSWLTRNRKDVLTDIGIKTEKTASVSAVYYCLKNKLSE